MSIADELGWCNEMILRGAEVSEVMKVELERLPLLAADHFGVFDLAFHDDFYILQRQRLKPTGDVFSME